MPFTVAGQWRIFTAFPCIPRTCFLRCQSNPAGAACQTDSIFQFDANCVRRGRSNVLDRMHGFIGPGRGSGLPLADSALTVPRNLLVGVSVYVNHDAVPVMM